ncbi:MAG: MaoC family dehydratase [Actinobacteria bacterium]|nr:MaoC family dehydratase [Actinomycetota bacterium]
MELETVTTDESGDVVYFNRLGVFLVGEGGFGGEKGTPPGNVPPQREPDKVVEISTVPQQALIYRLSGDPNPLHVDANFAKMVGFDRPILHGLCTFGIAGRAVLQAYCDNDPEKFKSIKVRFSKHVYPGETIVTEMWDEGDGKILFKAKTAERGEPVMTNAVVEIKQ